jgi:hypothetical protein
MVPVRACSSQSSGRDQKAAQREEHVDAQEAARDPAGVIREDGEHGNGAETIESRPIAEIEGFRAARHAVNDPQEDSPDRPPTKSGSLRTLARSPRVKIDPGRRDPDAGRFTRFGVLVSMRLPAAIRRRACRLARLGMKP